MLAFVYAPQGFKGKITPGAKRLMMALSDSRSVTCFCFDRIEY
jgi:hypothetical protein